MRHEEALELLTDFADGVLLPRQAAQLADHLTGCNACRDAVELYRKLRGKPRQRSTSGGRKELAIDGPETVHPNTDDLLVYALETHEWPQSRVANIEEHLRTCADCRGKVESIRRAEKRAESPSSLREQVTGALFGSMAPLRPAFVAGFVMLAVLAAFGVREYQGMRGLERELAASRSQLGQRQDENRSLRLQLDEWTRKYDQANGWGGGVQALVLHSPLRGRGSAVPTIRFEPDQLLHPIQIDLDLSREASRDSTFEIEVVIRDPSGREVWRQRTTAAASWNTFSQSVLILVPTRVLPPGRYNVEILMQRASSAIPFGAFDVGPPVSVVPSPR